jgi:hypothetical protein
MREKRIKYKVYGELGHGTGTSSGYSKIGKYMLKPLHYKSLYVVEDDENKMKYQMAWREMIDFSRNHKKFENIQAWYESLDKEIQETISRIPINNNKMEEEKEKSE